MIYIRVDFNMLLKICQITKNWLHIALHNFPHQILKTILKHLFLEYLADSRMLYPQGSILILHKICILINKLTLGGQVYHLQTMQVFSIYPFYNWIRAEKDRFFEKLSLSHSITF